MNDSLMTGVVSIALGILGVATLAVIFSQNANTSNVIQAGGSALANNIIAAVSPISGGSAPTGNFSYPSSFR
jgi:hypothetical protein